jgi:hypothetical protein
MGSTPTPPLCGGFSGSENGRRVRSGSRGHSKTTMRRNRCACSHSRTTRRRSLRYHRRDGSRGYSKTRRRKLRNRLAHSYSKTRRSVGRGASRGSWCRSCWRCVPALAPCRGRPSIAAAAAIGTNTYARRAVGLFLLPTIDQDSRHVALVTC